MSRYRISRARCHGRCNPDRTPVASGQAANPVTRLGTPSRHPPRPKDSKDGRACFIAIGYGAEGYITDALRAPRAGQQRRRSRRRTTAGSRACHSEDGRAIAREFTSRSTRRLFATVARPHTTIPRAAVAGFLRGCGCPFFIVLSLLAGPRAWEKGCGGAFRSSFPLADLGWRPRRLGGGGGGGWGGGGVVALADSAVVAGSVAGWRVELVRKLGAMRT